MGRTLSTQAASAKAIRHDLKAAFPTVSFRVHSDSFAGGDSVDIEWIDGPTTEQVDALVRKYQYGHFDGMIDLYESSNRRDDIPQTKYVQTRRDPSPAAFAATVAYLNRRYGWSLAVATTSTGHPYVDNASDKPIPNCGGWQSQEVWRVFSPLSLLCAACTAATLPGDAYCPQCGACLNAT